MTYILAELPHIFSDNYGSVFTEQIICYIHPVMDLYITVKYVVIAFIIHIKMKIRFYKMYDVSFINKVPCLHSNYIYVYFFNYGNHLFSKKHII